MAELRIPAFFRKLAPASAAFAVGAAALTLSVVNTAERSGSNDSPEFAAPAVEVDNTAAGTPFPSSAPPATPTPVPSAIEPSVLSSSANPGEPDADSSAGLGSLPAEELVMVDVEATLWVSAGPDTRVDAEPIDTAQIRNDALHAVWEFTTPDADEEAADFFTLSVIIAGQARFSPATTSVVEIRCVSGACNGWEAWTALPIGAVTPTSATTLVARSALPADATLELRTTDDPSTYRIS